MLQQYISGLKGHQALSPGHRPGDKCSGICALKGQKLSGVSALPLQGEVSMTSHNTQGDALGCWLFGLSGHIYTRASRVPET